MKAAVLRTMGLPAPYAISRPISIEDLELAEPGPNEVRLRIMTAGLCHSDLSAVNGDRPWPLPMVLGHEAAGLVDAVGAQVGDLAVGDQVGLVFRPSCGSCEPCAVGRPALCEPGGLANAEGRLLGGYRRLRSIATSASGVADDFNHHLGCSAFAEYAVVSRHSVVKFEHRLPWEHAALFGCAVLTGAGAVFNTAKLEAGAKVAVVGLGGVGCAAVLAALAAGAASVVVIDPLPNKREFALALGADAAFDALDPEHVQQVKAWTQGGVHVAFDMAGAVPALDTAYRVTRRGGLTVSAGLPNPSALWSLQAVSLIAEERTLKGSYIGSSVPRRDLPRYVDLFRRGRLPVDRLISGELGLDEINLGLDRLREGTVMRQILRVAD